MDKIRSALERLLEIQIEQNELAARIAFAQAQRAFAMHIYFGHGGGRTNDAEAELERLRDQFQKNQELIRRIHREVTAIPCRGNLCDKDLP